MELPKRKIDFATFVSMYRMSDLCIRGIMLQIENRFTSQLSFRDNII